MASMMGGDFVEAYVLKNAYKEKMKRMDQVEAAAAAPGSAKSGKDKEAAGAAGEKKAAGGGGASIRGGFFGLMKKKVHPKPKAAAAFSWRS
uniref:Uncharacterized protein n=1 Tax=Aegilops tauschii subsp. strangulata TaxID=200361 RepID=A0A453MZY5_AEGTS